jgi:hypothetical protein
VRRVAVAAVARRVGVGVNHGTKLLLPAALRCAAPQQRGRRARVRCGQEVRRALQRRNDGTAPFG